MNEEGRMTADERRAWIARLVENNVIGTATEIRRQYIEYTGHEIGFNTIRRDVKVLGMILMPHGRGGEEKRYRMPTLITGRDIEYELIHRFRVDVQEVRRELDTQVVVTTNKGVVHAVSYLLKLAREEEVIAGVAYILSDADDTIVIFCDTVKIAKRLRDFLHRMLYAPPHAYRIRLSQLEEGDDTDDDDAD